MQQKRQKIKKKRLINKERLEFEKLLDSTFKESFLTKNVNTALAKRVAENICHKHVIVDH